jgi:hypothetical protein
MANAPSAREARVVLSEAGSTAVASLIGPRAEFVDGSMSPPDSAGVQLRVTHIRRTDGRDENYEEPFVVKIPTTAIAQLQVKKVNTAKSVLLAGAVVAGSALVVKGTASSQGSGSGSPVPGGTK